MSGSAVVRPTIDQHAPAFRRRLPVGAEPLGDDRTHVRVWAPSAAGIDVVLDSGAATSLDREEGGYFSGLLAATAGARYQFRIDGGDRLYPDPASRFQPHGPHGVSEIVDPISFSWTDHEWRGATFPA